MIKLKFKRDKFANVNWTCKFCGNDFFLTYKNRKPWMWSGYMDCLICKDDSDNLNKFRHAL